MTPQTKEHILLARQVGVLLRVACKFCPPYLFSSCILFYAFEVTICTKIVSLKFQLSFKCFCLFKGHGTVATGRIEQGVIKVGEEVEVLGLRQINA